MPNYGRRKFCRYTIQVFNFIDDFFYNQQMQLFVIIYFYKALHVSGDSSTHHGWDGTPWSPISSTIPACSSIGWQYVKLNVQLCAPDDGRRNRPKHVEPFRNK
jgi:hypothetical protein